MNKGGQAVGKQGVSLAPNPGRVAGAPDTITVGRPGPLFRLDEKEHIYYEGARIIPSVTDIVGDICGEPQYATEWHMNRGSMIHRAIALYLQGRLDEKSVDERIRGRIEAAKRAIKELSLADYSCLETPMLHPLYQFAGTPDEIVRDILPDWKSSHQAGTEIQLGGYVLLAEAQHYKIKTCIEIILNDDGKYHPIYYKAARCRGLFLAANTIYQWRHNGK